MEETLKTIRFMTRLIAITSLAMIVLGLSADPPTTAYLDAHSELQSIERSWDSLNQAAANHVARTFEERGITASVQAALGISATDSIRVRPSFIHYNDEKPQVYSTPLRPLTRSRTIQSIYDELCARDHAFSVIPQISGSLGPFLTQHFSKVLEQLDPRPNVSLAIIEFRPVHEVDDSSDLDELLRDWELVVDVMQSVLEHESVHTNLLRGFQDEVSLMSWLTKARANGSEVVATDLSIILASFRPDESRLGAGSAVDDMRAIVAQEMLGEVHVAIELESIEPVGSLLREAGLEIGEDRVQTLPHLRAIWDEVSELEIGPALAKLGTLSREESESIDSLTIAGVHVPLQWATLFGPLLLLVFQLYLFIHIDRLLKLGSRGESLLSSFPWIGLFPDSAGRFLLVATTHVIPIAAIVVLTAASPELSALDLVGSGVIVIAIFVLGTCIVKGTRRLQDMAVATVRR